MSELNSKLLAEPSDGVSQPCKKNWVEYQQEMSKAQHTLENSMGSYQFETEFAQVKGYMQGYLAGMSKMATELDL